MGNKIPLVISTLTLLLGSTCFSPGLVWAAEDRTSWTFEEMAALSDQIEAEIEANCVSDDPDPIMSSMCKEMYIRGKSGKIYRALESYQQSQFFVRTINPSRKTITAHFNDINYVTRHMGGVYQHGLADLYMVQFDQGQFGDNYVRNLNNGIDPPYQHTLIYELESVNGPEWFERNTDREFSVPNLSTEPEVLQYLWYTYTLNAGGSYGEYVDFSSCTSSPDYQEGMECQIRFGDNMPFYVPVAVNTPTEGPAETPVEDPTDNPTNNPTEDPTTDEPTSDPTEEPNEQPTENPITDDSIENPTTDSVESPVTDSTEAPIADSTEAPDRESSSENSTTSFILATVTTNRSSGQQTSGSSSNTKSTWVKTSSSKTASSQTYPQAQSNQQAKTLALATSESSAEPVGEQSTNNTDTTKDEKASETVSLPLSGSHDECEKETIFPWWFIILVTVCDAALMWFFWPKPKKEFTP